MNHFIRTSYSLNKHICRPTATSGSTNLKAQRGPSGQWTFVSMRRRLTQSVVLHASRMKTQVALLATAILVKKLPPHFNIEAAPAARGALRKERPPSRVAAAAGGGIFSSLVTLRSKAQLLDDFIYILFCRISYSIQTLTSESVF